MRPTRPRVLAVLGLGTALLFAAVLVTARPLLPVVPWTVPVTLLVLDLGVLVVVTSFRRRLLGAPGARPYDALQASRMVVLAKACSHAGAVVAGAYAGLAVALVTGSGSALRRLDALLAGGAALAAVALVALGLLLERICRVPPPDQAGPADGAGFAGGDRPAA